MNADVISPQKWRLGVRQSVFVCAAPDERFAAGALGTVVQNVLQRQREGQALRVRDVQVRDVVQVVHAHEHLVFGRVGYVVLLPGRERGSVRPGGRSAGSFYGLINCTSAASKKTLLTSFWAFFFLNWIFFF